MTGNDEEETQGDGSMADEEANSTPQNNNEQDDDTRSSLAATTQRTHSALHNRLLNQQRSNILLQVLFHHMLNSRRRREEEEALALSPPPLPDREMTILSHDDALATNAMCRFCFEGSTGEEGSALVAPCNCAGGSRWVHLECLRQWQRLQVRNLSQGDDQATTYTVAGYICNVCNSPYLSRPPAVRSIRRNLLKRGTLLVSKPNVGRTFQQTVVLLLSDDVCGNPNGAFGLIVNSPMQEEVTPTTNLLQPSGEDSNEQNVTITNNDAVIEWRRGGPVCGGRLGVVHYTVLHTFPPSFVSDLDDVLDVDIDEEYFDETDDGPQVAAEGMDLDVPLTDNSESDQEDDDDDDIDDQDDVDNLETEGGVTETDTCAPLSLPVFDVERNTPPLQFVATPHSSLPSTFSEDSLGHTVQRLVRDGSNAAPTEQETDADDNHNDDDDDDDAATAAQNKVVVFSGYCKWRSGQLEREIQREVWDVCIDATPADILRNHGSGFWEEISESDRLLSWQGLIEEGEGLAEEDGGAED